MFHEAYHHSQIKLAWKSTGTPVSAGALRLLAWSVRRQIRLT
jgi:hypothetical protein